MMCIVEDLIENPDDRAWLKLLVRLIQRHNKGRKISFDDLEKFGAYLFQVVEIGAPESIPLLDTALTSINWPEPTDEQSIKHLKTVCSYVGVRLERYNRRVRIAVARRDAEAFMLKHGRDALFNAFKNTPIASNDDLPLCPGHTDSCQWYLVAAWLRGENTIFDRHAETLLKRAQRRMEGWAC